MFGALFNFVFSLKYSFTKPCAKSSSGFNFNGYLKFNVLVLASKYIRQKGIKNHTWFSKLLSAVSWDVNLINEFCEPHSPSTKFFNDAI